MTNVSFQLVMVIETERSHSVIERAFAGSYFAVCRFVVRLVGKPTPEICNLGLG